MKSILLLLGLFAALPAAAQSPRWVLAWAAPAAAALAGDATKALADGTANNQTLRILVTPDMVGVRMRLRLSNRFGARPLELDDIWVAASAGGAAQVAHSARAVSFKAARRISIPAGGSLWTDAFAPPLGARTLTISLRVVGLSPALSAGAGTGYATASGGRANEDGEAEFIDALSFSPILEAMEIQPAVAVQSVAIIGDAPGATSGDGWPDILRRRLPEASGEPVVVARLATPGLTLAALARALDDDFLPPTLGGVLLSAGQADITAPRPNPEAAADAFATLARRLRALLPGAKLVATTLPPLARGGLAVDQDRARAALNQFVRLTDSVDQVADLDAAVAAPDGALRSAFVGGPGGLPDRAGQLALAAAVPFASLLRGSATAAMKTAP